MHRMFYTKTQSKILGAITVIGTLTAVAFLTYNVVTKRISPASAITGGTRLL